MSFDISFTGILRIFSLITNDQTNIQIFPGIEPWKCKKRNLILRLISSVLCSNKSFRRALIAKLINICTLRFSPITSNNSCWISRKGAKKKRNDIPPTFYRGKILDLTDMIISPIILARCPSHERFIPWNKCSRLICAYQTYKNL